MITIDKSDSLYKYLQAIGVEDIEKEYSLLAKNGRYKRDDVRAFWQSTFQPSLTKEIDEKELEPVVDYYSDLKKIKPVSKKELNLLLKMFYETKSEQLKSKILSSQLKDILHLSINYKTMHENVDLQDLVQIASLGLIKALKKYNPTHNIDFKDYQLYWIRDTITKVYEEKKI